MRVYRSAQSLLSVVHVAMGDGEDADRILDKLTGVLAAQVPDLQVGVREVRSAARLIYVPNGEPIRLGDAACASAIEAVELLGVGLMTAVVGLHDPPLEDSAVRAALRSRCPPRHELAVLKVGLARETEAVVAALNRPNGATQATTVFSPTNGSTVSDGRQQSPGRPQPRSEQVQDQLHKQIDQAYGAATELMREIQVLAHKARGWDERTKPNHWADLGSTYAAALITWHDLTRLATPAVITTARRVYPLGSPAVRFGKMRTRSTVLEVVQDALGCALRNTMYFGRDTPLDGGAKLTWADALVQISGEWKQQDPDAVRRSMHCLQFDALDLEEIEVHLHREALAALAAEDDDGAPAAGTEYHQTALTANDIVPAAELEELERSTPPLVKNNGQWVSNKDAAGDEGLETRTLSKYRSWGIQNEAGTLGRDCDGRVWRRTGTTKSHPWYLKSTLKSKRKPGPKP